MLPLIDLARGIAQVSSGRFDKGTAWLHDSHDQLSKQGNKRPIGRLHLALGELHLKSILGLDPSFPFLYWENSDLPRRATPEAAEQAERHLNEAVSVSLQAGMPGIAACALNARAVIRSLDSRVEEAANLVQRAHELAAPLDWTTLHDRLITH